MPDQGRFIQSGPGLFVPKPIDLFEYGNSYTARSISAGPPLQTSMDGLGVMLEAKTLGKFRMKYSNIIGISGETSSYLLANFAENVASNSANFDWLLMWASCVNDYSNGISPSTSLANLQSIAQLCLSLGKILLLGTPYATRTSGPPTQTQMEIMGQTNRLVGNWARETTGVIYFDFYNDWVDASLTTGAASTNVMDTDGLHPAFLGIQNAAQRAIECVGKFLPDAPQTQAQWDIYDPTNNPSGNIIPTASTPGLALLQGADGTIGAGFSGATPTGFTVSRTLGLDSLVSTKIPAVSGYSSVGGDQVAISVANPSGLVSGALSIDVQCPITLIGQPVEALCVLTIPAGVTGVYLQQLELLPDFSFSAGTVWGLQTDALNVTPWLPEKYLLRTPPLVVPSGTTTLSWVMLSTFNAGATASVALAKPIIRLVLD